jgi:hypothetical protein
MRVPCQNHDACCDLLVYGARSGGAPVLVDHADEHAATMYGRVELDHDARIVVGWVLVKALMRPVLVEVPGIAREHDAGVPLR